MKSRTLNIGIMSLEQYKRRTINIAKGIYKVKKDEPKIWFTSIKSMAQILSDNNKALLRVILGNKQQSLIKSKKLDSSNV